MDAHGNSATTTSFIPDHKPEEVEAQVSLSALDPISHPTLMTSYGRCPVPYDVAAMEGTWSVALANNQVMALTPYPFMNNAGAAGAVGYPLSMVAYRIETIGGTFADTLPTFLWTQKNNNEYVPHYETTSTYFRYCPLGVDVEINIRRSDRTKDYPLSCVSSPSRAGVHPNGNAGIEGAADYAEWGRNQYELFRNAGSQFYPYSNSGTVQATNSLLPYRATSHISLKLPKVSMQNGSNEYNVASPNTLGGYCNTPQVFQVGCPWTEISNTTGASVTVVISVKMKIAAMVSATFATLHPSSVRHETSHQDVKNLFRLASAGSALVEQDSERGHIEAKADGLRALASTTTGVSTVACNAISTVLGKFSVPGLVEKHSGVSAHSLTESPLDVGHRALASLVAKGPVHPSVVAKSKSRWGSALSSIGSFVKKEAAAGLRAVENNPEMLGALLL